MLFYDFYVFYSAAILLHSGQSPYDFQAYQEAFWASGFPTSKIIYPFPYPPWTLLLIWPLGLLSFNQALAITSIIGVGAVILLAPKILMRLDLPPWLSRSRLLFFIMTFIPFLKTILFGQLSWIFFVGLALGAILLEKRMSFLAGVTLALLSFKAHLAVLPLMMILSSSLRIKDTKIILGLMTGGVILFASSYQILDLNLSEYFKLLKVSPHGDESNPIITAAIFSWLSPYVTQHLATLAALSASALTGIILGLKLKPTIENIFLVAAPLTLLLTPYAWGHDYLILLPAALFALRNLFWTSERGALYLWSSSMLLFAVAVTEAEWTLPVFLVPLLPGAYRCVSKPSSETHIIN